MKPMSQREAARIWGLPRVTVQRAVASGKLSLTGDKKIDPAEMSRHFGNPRGESEPDRASQSSPIVAASDAAEHARLKAENEGLKQLLAAKDQHLQDMQRALQVLTHQREIDGERMETAQKAAEVGRDALAAAAALQSPRRRWWSFGR